MRMREETRAHRRRTRPVVAIPAGVGMEQRVEKANKYVAVCPDLFCNYSAIAYNGPPSPKLVKHLKMWHPMLPVLAQEWHTCRYHLSPKQWKARRYPKRGLPMAPLPSDTFDEEGRRIRWRKR